jgi:hypothetical protein
VTDDPPDDPDEAPDGAAGEAADGSEDQAVVTETPDQAVPADDPADRDGTTPTSPASPTSPTSPAAAPAAVPDDPTEAATGDTPADATDEAPGADEAADSGATATTVAGDDEAGDATTTAADTGDETGTAPVGVDGVAPDSVPRDAGGGLLAARLREARARLEPERIVVPEPRSPEGVVSPPVLGEPRTPAADLVRAVDQLLAVISELEQEPEAPDQAVLVRVVELSSTGVPEAGWSIAEGIDAESLAGAAELAGTLQTSAEALLDRLDAEERDAPAVEVGAVVTALQVARMVVDLESFTRHGR